MVDRNIKRIGLVSLITPIVGCSSLNLDDKTSSIETKIDLPYEEKLIIPNLNAIRYDFLNKPINSNEGYVEMGASSYLAPKIDYNFRVDFEEFDTKFPIEDKKQLPQFDLKIDLTQENNSLFSPIKLEESEDSEEQIKKIKSAYKRKIKDAFLNNIPGAKYLYNTLKRYDLDLEVDRDEFQLEYKTEF